jgi:GNAT superfamily N-acetyltransferase
MIRGAEPTEAVAISTLAIRSKSHWGYTPEQLSVFQRELTLTGADLAARRAHVFEENARVVGFYTLLERPDSTMELEHLFVDPRDLGRGVGTALFEHACAAAVATGHTRLVYPERSERGRLLPNSRCTP